MPLYVADYIADTGHLSATEHGAYLLLIMHYWQNGSLPVDDVRLARIARMTQKEWAKSCATIAAFFSDGWGHKRIDEELARAEQITNKRKAAGIAGAEARYGKPIANATVLPLQTHTPSQSHRQLQENKDAAHAASPEESDEVALFNRGKQILGNDSGGLIKNLLAAKNKNVALARAALETASTKQNAREYIGAIVRGRDSPDDLRARGDAW
jgi:uncharacterized protein YdaU (DUF1376 family)